MSLINDALRDLDVRKENACVVDGESSPSEVSLLAEGSLSKKDSLVGGGFKNTMSKPSSEVFGGVDVSIKSKKYRLYAIVGILILLCGGYVSLYQSVLSSSQKERKNTILIGAQPQIGRVSEGAESKSNKINSQGEQQKSKQKAVQTISAKPQSVIEGGANSQELIAQYLDKASLSISQNRLSVPVRNNAIYFLNKALNLEPENKRAKEQLKDITALYVQQIDYALVKKNIARAKILVSRSDRFGLNSATLGGYLSDIENIENIESEGSSGFSLAEAYRGGAEVNKEGLNELIWVNVTPESEDLQKVEIAKEYFSRGDVLGGIQLLERYLDLHPQAINSLVFLFDFHVDNADLSMAQNILAELPEVHDSRTYFTAQITRHLLGEKQAITILESSPPNEKMKEKQGAYLAALYQKEKRYQDAQRTYIELLKIDESNPRYLLGFAVAADAGGDSFRSLRAYKKLLILGHSSDKVASFVRKRVKILSASSQKEVSAW